MITVITPVGTSLFTNYLRKHSDNTFSRYYDAIEKRPASDWDESTIQRAKQSLEKTTEKFIRKDREAAAAELQSTAKIRRALRNHITVHLLASDTIASRSAAEILRDQINSPNNILGDQIEAKFNPDPAVGHIDVISNLQVTDRTDFSRDGMPNLFHRINYIKDWEAGGSQNLAINITGGYGATLPYLTIFGQLKSVPLYYNFEGSDELIVIPQAPLAIDWDLIDGYSNVLEQIDKGIKASDWQNLKKDNYQVVKELDAFIWWDAGTGACLSPIGVIFWDQYLKSRFIVDLAKDIRINIDDEILELYAKLAEFLREYHYDPSECYKAIRLSSDQGDLNHTGAVQDHDIFIFKSTNNDQIRLMYTFEVNGRAITRIKIYDKRGHMTKKEYKQWKKDMQTQHATIIFGTRTFGVPTKS